MSKKIVPILFDKIPDENDHVKEENEYFQENNAKEPGQVFIRRRVAQLYKDVDNLEDDEMIKLLMMTLKKNPEKRSKYDIEVLMNVTGRISFFLELSEKNGSEILRKCCKFMFYEYKTKDEYVFRQGEEGHTFYIMLRGKAEVEVSYKVQKFSEDLKEIYFEPITDIVRVYKGGDSFGELALLENKPRSASIRCIEDCFLATLEKANFQEILKDIETRKLVRNLKALGDMKIFSNWTNTKLKSLMLRFIEKRYERNQIVYKEGDKADGIYLIQSGEFLVSKKIHIQNDHSLKNTVDPATFQTSLIKDSLLTRSLEVAFLEKGELFGEDDCYFNWKRKFDVKCQSTTGVLFFLSKTEFMRQMSDEEYSIKFLKAESSEKEERYNNRIRDMIENNIKPQKSLSKMASHNRSSTYSGPNRLFAAPQDISFIFNKKSDEISKNISIFPLIATTNTIPENTDSPNISFIKPHQVSFSLAESYSKERDELKTKIRKFKEGQNQSINNLKILSRKKNTLQDKYEYFSPQFAGLEEFEVDVNLKSRSANKLNLSDKLKPLALKKIKEDVLSEKLQYLIEKSPFLSKYIDHYPVKLRRDLLRNMKQNN